MFSWQKELQEVIKEIFYEGRVKPEHTDTEHFYVDEVTGEKYASVTTKTSLLSRDYYKQMAANKAVDCIADFLSHNETYEIFDLMAAFDKARQAHSEDLNRAGMWGTHGHDLVDRYVTEWISSNVRPDNILSFVTDEISNEGKCAGLSASMFFDDFTLFPIASELKVISQKHKYAGTLDSLWLVGEVYKERTGDKLCIHNWYEKRKDTIHCMTCHREEKLSILLGDWKTSNAIFGYGSMGKYEYALQVSAYSQALHEMAGIKTKKHWIVRLDKMQPKYEVGVIQDIKHSAKCFNAMGMVSDFARSNVPPIIPLISKQEIRIV